ncbi:MAG: Ig-like domain-containing protein, partial [Proteobacteria bacterium]|nr:Ig-like domain-containing protein [Pseudomonadota bacterium]
GFQTVTFLDGDPYVQVVFGTPRTYFVTALFTETAGDQTPAAFRVIHHTRSSSTAEDRDHDLPLELEFAENVTATVSTYNLGPSDISLTNSTVSEDASPATLIGYISCTDPEGDYPCSLEPLFGAEPFTLIGNALILAGPLDYETNPVHLLPVRAEDSKGAESHLTLTITVIDVNEAPEAVGDSATVAEGGTVTILDSPDASVADNDSDPEAGILTVDTTPAIAPVNGLLTLNANGTFSYTHNGGETTADSFEYEVCDDGTPSLCDTAVVSIAITPVNDTPDAVDDSATVAEGGSVSILSTGQASLLANDTDQDSTLMLNTSPVTAPVNGTITLYSSGAFSYSHNGGETASDSFNYKACDNGAPAKCDYALVTITITPVNDAPVAVADSILVAEGGTATTLTPSGNNLLTNDTDPDSTKTAKPATWPSNGTATVYTNGTFQYIHNGGETTTDSFSYTACDGTTCSTAIVSITITPVNDNPVANADSAAAAEGGMVSILSTGQASLLANDTDPDSTLTVNTTPVSAPANGTVTLYASGAFLYVHNGSETTTDSFTYRACDSGPLCANAVVSITITPVNDAPTTMNDTATVAEGGTITTLTSGVTSLLANDADPDGTMTLTTTPVNGPFSGTLTLNAGGTFSYIHNGSETLNDSFTYEVCDNGAPKLCATALVRINITPVNDPPVAGGDFAVLNEGGTITTLIGGATSLLANDSDPDSASLTVKATPVSGPYHGTLILYSGGTFSYVHDGSDTLNDSFTYQACDYGASPICANATVIITVIPVDDAPVGTTPAAILLGFDDYTPHGTISGMEGIAISFTVGMANPVTGIIYEIQGLPEGASFDVSTGIFSWTPVMSDYGEWLITITATDGKSLISRDISIFVDYLDADQDYLPDTWEVSVGLNPASLDSDADGIDDYEEAGPGALLRDTDGDGTADALSDDSDGDGISDTIEAGDTDLSTAPWDTDGDGVPDYRDLDSDNDGVADATDNCRLVANANQADKDKNGVGDVCDADFKPNYGGGGCGCTIGPNQPGNPLGLIGFLLVGIWIAVKKRKGQNK